MKEYLIVYSYIEKHYNFGNDFDNDKDCILAHIPNIDNEIIEANNKKEAMKKFLEYRDRCEYSILNIIELGDNSMQQVQDKDVKAVGELIVEGLKEGLNMNEKGDK